MKIVGCLVVLVCASLVPACGGESKNNEHVPSGGGGDSSDVGASGGPSVGPETPLEDYPHLYTQSLCRVVERCDPRVVVFTGAAGCVTTLEPMLREQTFGRIQTSIAAGTVTYHPEALPKCLSDWEKASCDDAIRDVPSCEAVFSGNLATGAACQNDVECEGRRCLVTDQCPGACGERAALGEPCISGNDCANGLQCEGGRCEQVARIGEACDASTPCLGYGLCYGDPATPDEPSRCVARGTIPRAKEGDPCEITQEPICADGLVCTQEDGGLSFGRCQPKVAADGDCTYSFPDACPTGQYCRITSTEPLATGVCSNPPALGESCVHETIYTAPCAADQLCDRTSGRCILGKHLNEACAADDECFSTHCSAVGVCTSELECERDRPM